MTKTITITSGKGGVGKTNLTANLALQISEAGYSTCVFDADLGLANINILLSLYPEYTIEDVIQNRKHLSDIIIKNYHGIDIIPGSSSLENIAELEKPDLERLANSFSELSGYDYMLFDTSAGISKNVLSFCLSSSEIILVITPEPTSLTDAYALLKILSLNKLKSPVKIVVNQCKNTDIAKNTFLRFRDAVSKYLSVSVQPLGVLLTDPKVTEAVRLQKPFIKSFPNCTASRCIKSITKNILKNSTEVNETYHIDSFWHHCFKVMKGKIVDHKVTDKPDEVTVQKVDAPATGNKKLNNRETMVEDKVNTTPGPADTAKAESSHPGSRDIMISLVKSIDSIHTELKQLRKCLKNNKINIPRTDMVNSNRSAQENFSIVLDFDKYLQQHNGDH